MRERVHAADVISRTTGLSFSGLHGERMLRQLERAAHEDWWRAAPPPERSQRWAELIDRLTVGETYFFREPAHFEILRNVARAAARTPGARLRVWSAGCATGEEAYSAAIVLDEEGMLVRSVITATDLSEPAIRRARSARYRPWSLRRLDAAPRAAYFEERDGWFALADRYTRAVDLAAGNLLDPAPPGPFDVIFCRNVLLYLTDRAVDAAARRLRDALAADGWLFTGAGDPVLDVDGLEPLILGGGVAYRRRAAPAAVAPVPAARPAPPLRREPPKDRDIEFEDPPVEPHYERAVAHLGAGRYKEAIREARAATYLRPDLIVAHLVRGYAHRFSGDASRARSSFLTAFELASTLPATSEVELAGEPAGTIAATAARLASDRAATIR